MVANAAETVSLRLDIDKGHDAGDTYPYPWRPATGNLMYCMPQVGTRVSLYFPTLDERKAMAVNCVRTNGASCDRMSDPSKRAFVTEHGKELTLYPDEMGLKGGIGQITLSDAEGIKLSSDGKIQIVGADVRLEAPVVTLSAPKNELVMVKTDATLQTAESTFSMSYAYEMLSSKDTVVEGSERKELPSYGDQPAEGEFDGWGLFGNILAGLAAVAVVALAIAVTVGTGGLAGAAIIGACVVGTIAVGGKAYSDYKSGSVSDTLEYINIGFRGAAAGAVCGVLPGGTGMLGIGAASVAEGLIERVIMGESTGWSDLLIDFGIGAFGFGLLDNLNRRFKLTNKLGSWIKKSLGKTAKETAEETAERAAKEAAEEAAERTAKEAAEGAANHVPPFDSFDPKTATSAQKGNYGEYVADVNMTNNQDIIDAGYDLTSIGRTAPISPDDKIVKGIDGIYQNTNPNSKVEFVIDEAKFGSSTQGMTKDNLQMSDDWLTGTVTGNDRILDAVGGDANLARKITQGLKNGTVDRVLSKIKPDGTVITFLLDFEGKVISTWP